MSITCPKCGHLREPGTEAPAWQCPSCGVAYNKVAPKTEATPAPAAAQVSAIDTPAKHAGSARRILRSKWLVLAGLVLLVAGGLSYRHHMAYREEEPRQPELFDPNVVQMSEQHDLDRASFEVFMSMWAQAQQQAYAAGRNLPASGEETPRFTQAMLRLDALQQNWRAIQFRTTCYRNNQVYFSEALEAGKAHVRTYATAPDVPEDTATARLAARYRGKINSCSPRSEQLTE